VVDDHDGSVGDVHADLDDGGGDEDVDLAAGELAHGGLFFGRRKAAVKEAEAETGESACAELVEHICGGTELLFGEEGRGFSGFCFCNLFGCVSGGLGAATLNFGDEAGGDGVGGGVGGGGTGV